jgi:competence protein ComFC
MLWVYKKLLLKLFNFIRNPSSTPRLRHTATNLLETGPTDHTSSQLRMTKDPIVPALRSFSAGWIECIGRFWKRSYTIVNYILSQTDILLSPMHCNYCLDTIDTRDIFCQFCYDRIKPIVSITVPIDHYQVPVYAVSHYTEPIKSLILAKAYAHHNASIYLARLIWQLTPLKNLEFDYLVPVPLHWTRFAKRGYNQAEIMAQELARLSGKPVINILKRQVRTPFQSLFSKADREKNVRAVFALNHVYSSDIKDKTIVVIDDLLTTGATIRNCAQLLAGLKPKKIIAAVGART